MQDYKSAQLYIMYTSGILSLLFLVIIQYQLVVVLAFSSTTPTTDTINIIRTYTIFGNNIDDKKNNIIHSVRPKPSNPNVEEDEIEMYYPTTKRAFMFPNTHNTNANEIMINNNMIVNIRETSFGCGKLGSTVWPSAIVLSCLLANESIDIKDKKIIELGSGCGLPSTYIANTNGLVHSILATDYWEEKVTADNTQSSSSTDSLYRNSGLGQTTNNGDRLMAKSLFGRNLAYNIGTDENENVSVKRLDWHDEMGIFKVATDYKPDVIIGSDLVYYPMDTLPLLQTIEMLCKAGGAKEALLIFPLNDGREALPDFRERLESGELGDEFEVIIDEIEMTDKWNDTDDDSEGDRHTFLRVRIHYNAI